MKARKLKTYRAYYRDGVIIESEQKTLTRFVRLLKSLQVAVFSDVISIKRISKPAA